MSMRSVVRVLMLVCLVALLLSSCTGGATTAPNSNPAQPPAAKQPADIKGTVKMYKGPFGANEVDLQNKTVAEFNKTYPNIKVIFETFDWPTQEQQITAALAGGTHDVIYIPEGMYPKFAYKGGPLEDLSKYVEDPTWQDARNNITYWDVAKSPDGLLGGVPYIWIPESHFVVNLDMLKAAGVPDDWNTSMDKVRAAAIAVKQKFPDAYGIAFRTGGLANFSQHDWIGYMLRSGANFLTPDFKKCGLNKPELVQTYQWLVDLQNKDKVTPEFGAYTWDGLRGLFQAGKIAIMHDEPPIAGVLKSNPPNFKYEFSGIPGIVNSNLLTFRGFWVIPAASKNKEAAWEVIKFWTKPESEVNYLNETSGLYPALKDTKGIAVFPNDPVLQGGLKLAKFAEGPQFHPQMVEFQNLVQPLFDDMMQGKITPQQLIDQGCQQIEAKLKK
ncbi:MAG: sugar ABC transporter substrate-binding protein [Anaerolineaceae bacterium]|nr:sugar ABC transporter substrate-binding protein [Anaerolineaceae bacterium]